MLQHYFILQFRILNRKLVDLGISLLLGYPTILIIFIYISKYIFQNIAYASYLYIFLGISLALPLSKYERNTFLKQHYTLRKYFQIRIVENSLVTMPCAIFLLYKNLYWESLTLLLMSLFMIFIVINKISNWVIPTPYFQRPFEFCIGFRKFFFLFPLFLSLAFIAIKVANINLGIASLLGCIIVSSTYYYKPENPYFVWIYSLTAKEFLRKKIIDGIKNMVLTTFPILFLLCLFFSDSIETIGTFYGLGILFFMVTILMKYDAFPDPIGIAQIVIVTICLYFPPILILFIPYFYKRAIHKLNTYL